MHRRNILTKICLCNLQKTTSFEDGTFRGGYDDTDSSKRLKPNFTPRVINMPAPGQYLIGGHPSFKRNIQDYKKLLEKVSYHRKTSDADNGRLLCMKYLREEVSTEELATKNVTGVSRLANGSKTSVPKLNEEFLRAIFTQAKHQFPGFTDWLTDPKCRTVYAINSMCRQARHTLNAGGKEAVESNDKI